MSLPETSTSDLRRMGITPEAIKDEVDRRGGKVDGDIVGYFLPPDGYLGDSKNHRVRNNIKRDWRPIRTTPPETIKVEDYNQSFQNFDGDEPIEFHFSHTVQVTTAEDYTQTQRFEISVNANIPLGQSGALVGFNAAMSSEDVKHKSKSVTDSREITFPLSVPAGEGRLVAQKTTVKSTTTLFESALEAEGSAGIEVDPAWWKPNVYWWFYYIESVLPGAEATSRIALNSTNTNVDTKIIKMPHPGNATRLAEVEDAHFFSTDVAASQSARKELFLEHICVGISPTQKDRPSGIPSPISATMTVAIKFDDTAPSVPFERRMRTLDTLQALILINVSSTGAFGAVFTTPRLASASFTVGYTKDINQPELEEAIIKQAHSIQWGGQYTISFS